MGVSVGFAFFVFVGAGEGTAACAVSSAAEVEVGKLSPGITVTGTFSAATQALIVMQQINIKVSCFKVGGITPQSLLYWYPY